MKIIDLTQTIEETMSVFPGDPLPALSPLSDLRGGGHYRLTRLEMTTHTGTHLDCPAHVLTDGATLDNMDLGCFAGPGIVIDCRDILYKTLELSVLEGYNLQGIEFILFFADCAKYWQTRTYWEYAPSLSMELLQYLAAMKSLKGIGLDFGTPDSLNDETLNGHRLLLENNRIIIENLSNLNQLLNRRFYFSALPLKIKNGDGSPVRAMAILDE